MSTTLHPVTPALPLPRRGRFYIIDLVPELGPQRVRLKFWFSRGVGARLAQIRQYNPSARLLGTCLCDDMATEYRIIAYIVAWLEGERITREICDFWLSPAQVRDFARKNLEDWHDD